MANIRRQDFIDNEYKDYQRFVNTYFPNSGLNENIQFLKKNIKSVFKCLYLIEILKDSVKSEVSKAQYQIILDSEPIFLRLLYILPAQDKYYVSLGFRATAENILRICLLSDSEDETIENARNSQYRFLWSSIKEKKVYTDHKLTLDKINDIFGKSSNIIHNKVPETEIINYLEEFMSGTTSYSINDMNNRLSTITTAFFDIVFSVYPLSYTFLSSHSTRVLRDLLTL